MPKDNGALMVALGGLKKPKGESAMGDEGEGDSDEMPNLKKEAAADTMAAFKSGDVDALDEAMTRFVRACEGTEY